MKYQRLNNISRASTKKGASKKDAIGWKNITAKMLPSMECQNFRGMRRVFTWIAAQRKTLAPEKK